MTVKTEILVPESSLFQSMIGGYRQQNSCVHILKIRILDSAQLYLYPTNQITVLVL